MAEPDVQKFSKPAEQTNIKIRTPDPLLIDKFKNDNEFRYDNTNESSLSLWDKLIQWIKELFIRLFFTDEYGALNDIVIYSLMGIALLIIIGGIFKSEIRNIFQKNFMKDDLTFSEFTENIHELNFDELILQQIQAKNFRFALRLTFLKLLKELDSKEIINWRVDKTNHELLNQIRDNRIYKSVSELTYDFENSWYGGFEVNERIYNQYKEKFSKLNSQLQVGYE